ncbi:hypothetical protein Ancab_007237 [Ancistrocladus abbreviatus]
MEKLFKSSTFSFHDHHSLKSSSPSFPPFSSPSSCRSGFKSSHSSSPSHHHHSPTPSVSSSSDNTLYESVVEETFNTAGTTITKWGYSPDSDRYELSESLFTEDRKEEASEFISTVNNLQAVMKYLLSTNPLSEILIHGQKLLQMAMIRLQREFYTILKTNKQYLHPESLSTRLSPRSSVSIRSSSHQRLSSSSSTSDFEDYDLVSEEDYRIESKKLVISAMNDLKLIADCMISSGYAKECAMVYKMVRKSIVDESLYCLRIERLCSSPNLKLHKMSWESLEPKIKNWLSAVDFVVRTLFNGEKILSDHVFSSSTTIRDSCFSEITGDGALSFFAFPEQIIAKRKKSPQKSFSPANVRRVLDLYEAIVDVLPEIECIFSSNSTSVIRSQAETSLQKLGEAVSSMIGEFESLIKKETAKSPPVAGGGLHPLTTNVMEYVTALSEYSVVLTEILGDNCLALPEDYFENGSGSDVHVNVTARFAWIILILLCKLDSKAGRYGDVALSYLFLMNNLRYVVDKIHKTVNLRQLLGERWLEMQEAKVRQYAESYERVGWWKVISALEPTVVGARSGGDTTADFSAKEAKEWFVKFTGAFEEAYRKQKEWVVVDGKMGDRIKVSLARKVVPVYGEVYEKHKGVLVSMEGAHDQVEPVVRFAPEDLEHYISNLLCGIADVGGGSMGNDSGSGSEMLSSLASSAYSSLSPSRVGRKTSPTHMTSSNSSP